jgi:hypothetical protein
MIHWQNLNEKRDGLPNGSGLWHGRCWWHLNHEGGFKSRTIALEWSLGIRQKSCHAGFGCDDEGWDVSFAIPFIAALYWKFSLGIPTPQRKCVATWDGGREFWLTDEREFRFAIHDWTIRLGVWERSGEWRSSDPWWIRGVSFNLPDFFLGRTKHTNETVGEFVVSIPMPEGSYPAKVRIEHCTWKRPRWFGGINRRDAWVDIPGGIPFPGKGENSWDCGMDGLFGYGCSSTKPEDVIAKGVQSVMESRRKYAGSVNWKPTLNSAQ